MAIRNANRFRNFVIIVIPKPSSLGDQGQFSATVRAAFNTLSRKHLFCAAAMIG
jgi:hypothetical protein